MCFGVHSLGVCVCLACCLFVCLFAVCSINTHLITVMYGERKPVMAVVALAWYISIDALYWS